MGKTSYEAKLALERTESQMAAVGSERDETGIPRDFTVFDSSFWQESLVDWDAFAYVGTFGN